MRNLPEWPAAFFGIALTGAIVTPLNAWWTGPELEYGLIDSGAKAAIVDAERLERLSEHLHNCSELRRVYVAREAEETAHPLVRRLEDLIGTPDNWNDLPAGALPAVTLDPEDDVTIFYTSGTTGKPKGALGTQRNLLCNIGAAGLAGARSFLRRGEQPPAPDSTAPQRCTLLAIPFFHVTGCHAILCPTIASGSKIVAIRKWEPEAAMRLIEREKSQLRRWRSDHRLAADRTSGAGELRSVLARSGHLWRRTFRAGAGAQDQGDLPEIAARQWLGHDRDLGHRNQPCRRGLREPAR